SAARGSSGGGELPPGKIVSGLSPAGADSGGCEFRRSSRAQATSVSAARTSPLVRKREDIDHASRSGLIGKVLRRVGEAERRRRVARIELGGNDRAGPAADA